MLPTDEDAFLPTDNDKIKAQIKELQVRLSVATEKRRQLRRQLIEEDLSHVVISKMTEAIKDPTRTEAHELEGLQKDIFEQLLIAAEQCTIREIISYHRLAGRTVFDYNKNCTAIRLETFYDKAYRESFYLLFLKSEPEKVFQHTIPKFIPVEVLQTKFLPNDLQTFLRIIHDGVQAFVVRREILKEIEDLSENYKIKVCDRNPSATRIEVEVRSADLRDLHITLLYKNFTSSFPSDIIIRGLFETEDRDDFDQLRNNLMKGNIRDILLSSCGDIDL